MSEKGKPIRPETNGFTDSDEPTQGLTRREWLLGLGEAAALAGFRGSVPEALTAAPQIATPAQASNQLPPGLYDPSGEHMAHALLRDDRFIAPPLGSETEYVAERAAAYAPAFFSADHFKVARRLVGLMLNSPGRGEAAPPIAAVDNQTLDEIAEWIDMTLSAAPATREAASNLSAQHRELAVHYYGEESVHRLEALEPDKLWKDGLAWLDAESRKLAAAGFLSLNEAQQIQLLESVSESAEAVREQAEASKNGTPAIQFYRLLKAEFVRGYYTSRAGLKEIDYKGNAFYPESPGCPNQ